MDQKATLPKEGMYDDSGSSSSIETAQTRGSASAKQQSGSPKREPVKAGRHQKDRSNRSYIKRIKVLTRTVKGIEASIARMEAENEYMRNRLLFISMINDQMLIERGQPAAQGVGSAAGFHAVGSAKAAMESREPESALPSNESSAILRQLVASLLSLFLNHKPNYVSDST